MTLTGVLLVGSLDLSQYMNVQQGQGMDPADPAFSDKQFSHSLLKEGGTLALENLQIKELAFPLFLKAETRDLLNGLVEQINLAVSTPGQTVTFQDVGSSEPTYFDLASGQFDLDYDYRRAGNFWMGGKLRLFCQPYARTATMRLAASAAGTGPVLVMPIPSAIQGDVPALMQARVQIGSQVATAGRMLGVSVLPGASGTYRTLWPLSQLNPTGAGGVVSAASGAIASQYIRDGGYLGEINLFGASCIPYFGDTRIIAIVRSPGGATSSLVVYNQLAQRTTPVTFTATDWSLVDLGVQRIPSALGATQGVVWQVFPGATCDLTGLITVPDNQTVFLSDSGNGQFFAYSPRDTYVFDGIGHTVGRIYTGWTPNVVGPEMSSQQRGSIPPISPSASQLAVFEMPAAGGAATDLIDASVMVRERVRFAF